MRGFCDAVLRKNAIACIPDMALLEISSIGDVERAFFMLRNLQLLLKGLGSRLQRSKDYKDLIQAEARRWLRFPVVTGWGEFEGASAKTLWGIAENLPESYDWLSKKKNEIYEFDRSMSKHFAADHGPIDPNFVVEAISAKRPPRVDDLVIEMAANLSDGLLSAEKIVADKNRFKATHLLSHLLYRLNLANAASPGTLSPEQEHVIGLWRTKGGNRGKGAWYDMFIAGAAAYNEFLISDDDNQRRRCEHLKKTGLLGFHPITLQEFLKWGFESRAAAEQPGTEQGVDA